MYKTKWFMNGKSQAVRLPKELRFKNKEIYLKKMGKTVILFPKGNTWHFLCSSLDQFSSDFMAKRKQPPLQKRPQAI